MTNNELIPFSRRVAEGVVLAVVCWAIYAAPGHLIPASARPLVTHLDAEIPFVPGSVWVYLPGYMSIFLITLVALRRVDDWRASVRAFLAMSVLALPFFVLFPMPGPRPPAPGGEGLTLDMVRWLYASDPVGNCFPSLHVANATLCAVTLWRVERRLFPVGAALAIGIAVSVLTLKQHWLVDIPAGLTLAGLGSLIWTAQHGRAPERAWTRWTELVREQVRRR